MISWMRNTISKLCKAVSATVAATRDVLAETLQGVRETASSSWNRLMDNIEYVRQRLKDILEKEAREKKEETTEQTEDSINLTSRANEKALKGAYRSFVIPRSPKVDIDS